MSAAATLLRSMFDAAVASAQPALCVPPYLPTPEELGNGRLFVIGAGKASAAMAQAVEQAWQGPLSGFVITRYGYGVPCERIEIVEAAHPVPDEAGLNAARRMMSFVSDLREDDIVLCLISGGGSALMPLPIEGLTLEHKQAVNRALALTQNDGYPVISFLTITNADVPCRLKLTMGVLIIRQLELLQAQRIDRVLCFYLTL